MVWSELSVKNNYLQEKKRDAKAKGEKKMYNEKVERKKRKELRG